VYENRKKLVFVQQWQRMVFCQSLLQTTAIRQDDLSG